MRLTPKQLDGLDEVIKAIDTEIEGLESSIPVYVQGSFFREKMVTRYNKLLEGRNYIAELVASTRKRK